MEQVTSARNLKEIERFKFDDRDYILVEPSAAMVREANKRRNRKFVECLKDGLPTKTRMQKQMLEGNPEFFNEFNTARAEVLQNIEETEALIKELDDPDQLDALSHILVIYRAELVEQEQMIRGIFESTADEEADDERNSYLVFAMMRDVNNDSLAEKFEDFLEASTHAFFEHCKYKLLCWEHKLDTNWEELLPEAKAVIRANHLREEAEKKEAEEKELKKSSRKTKKPATKKPATKKPATKKPATKKPATKKPATRAKKATRKKKVVTSEG